MLGNAKARNVGTTIATPFAKIFLKIGLTPDLITLIGTIGVSVVSLVYFSKGQFLTGSLLFALFVGLDAVDGTLARLLNRNSKWGAFFDLGSLAFYFAQNDIKVLFVLSLISLVACEIVSYTKARAESLGFKCDTGIAERPERIIIIIVGTLLAGVGFNQGLEISIWILTIVSVITVLQRMNFVFKQNKNL
jgi:CDP-diacylglycerol---glycerol-3-phosphate 3-phosphatidyltransferase